jgi:hypothetical protein
MAFICVVLPNAFFYMYVFALNPQVGKHKHNDGRTPGYCHSPGCQLDFDGADVCELHLVVLLLLLLTILLLMLLFLSLLLFKHKYTHLHSLPDHLHGNHLANQITAKLHQNRMAGKPADPAHPVCVPLSAIYPSMSTPIIVEPKTAPRDAIVDSGLSSDSSAMYHSYSSTASAPITALEDRPERAALFQLVGDLNLKDSAIDILLEHVRGCQFSIIFSYIICNIFIDTYIFVHFVLT